jgi:hypothetical protein
MLEAWKPLASRRRPSGYLKDDSGLCGSSCALAAANHHLILWDSIHGLSVDVIKVASHIARIKLSITPGASGFFSQMSCLKVLLRFGLRRVILVTARKFTLVRCLFAVATVVSAHVFFERLFVFQHALASRLRAWNVPDARCLSSRFRHQVWYG